MEPLWLDCEPVVAFDGASFSSSTDTTADLLDSYFMSGLVSTKKISEDDDSGGANASEGEDANEGANEGEGVCESEGANASNAECVRDSHVVETLWSDLRRLPLPRHIDLEDPTARATVRILAVQHAHTTTLDQFLDSVNVERCHVEVVAHDLRETCAAALAHEVFRRREVDIVQRRPHAAPWVHGLDPFLQLGQCWGQGDSE